MKTTGPDERGTRGRRRPHPARKGHRRRAVEAELVKINGSRRKCVRLTSGVPSLASIQLLLLFSSANVPNSRIAHAFRALWL